ncbi:fungal-specific transcription factor domain-containing protein [Pseudomassariella vexata]|uniref:Fungal-specific transcription factor domain-domain-containing protein n=1 Tax=Pseudomassariella vexata TaxID=1141098 RepID=A0A1Y2EHU1_9PEZI|nr:fungal-specific transcription factor domain-containing protein [Pseudomassariella vexata]ORY71142.1 fungal-specific transcription factor domain-domain-containing protein [Pseudomassariella vexata]
MTVNVPPQPKDTQAARKRRRRAPAGGAADDCFACIKRNAKCDRRRPYCSQCLEVGNECSGYKTQLTWGVGVASRGKLRGLSLPIAKSPPVAVAPVGKKTVSRSKANSSAISHWGDHDEGSRRGHRDDVEIHSVPTTPFATYNEFPRFSQGEMTPAATSTRWNPYGTSLSAHHDHPPKIHRLNTSLGHFPVLGDALSSSVDSLSDVEYTLSPMTHSFPREDLPFMHSPSLMYESYTGHNSPVPQSPASAIMIDQRAPTSCPGLIYAPSEHGSSLSSRQDVFESQIPGPRLLADCDTLSVPDGDSYSTSPNSTSPYWMPSVPRDDDATPHVLDQAASAPSAPYEGHSLQVSSDLIAKMPFFMDYYENIMCPSMVLIDGPNNPFRDHILRLASSSRSLQHAICALSACNLRMKRRLSLGQHNRDSPEIFKSEQAEAQPDDLPLSEEYQHRNLAVHLLNQQLNDPAKSCHDSVLATILLLSHYRMVESGVAKFQTQFAGVKKILAMRDSAPYQASSESSWMEAIFTYFDAISASINDREAQLNHSFYGVSGDAHLLPPGAENWIGCDRELFKTITKLGRLNLLSQLRPVQSAVPTPAGRVGTPPSSSPLKSPLANSFQPNSRLGDFFSMAHRFDGNGFATQLDEEEMFSSGLCSSPSYDDHRSTFWREWKDARMALQNWEFEPQRLLASLPTNSTSNEIRDLGSLSEAFRYAALLYTERLASPNVSSNHNNFRNLVSQVVYYATSLEAGSSAEKFLLWPLFVAGSECVNELQQNIVRNKCHEIMSRSGYMNNLSAIEVLERLWAGEYRDSFEMSPGSKLSLRRGPFNWTKCIGGPGIDVEWIMF